MRHYYRWLWPALLGLAACSTDTKPGREPGAAAAIRQETAPDTSRQSVTTIPAAPGNNVAVEPGKALIPDDAAATGPDTSQTDAWQRQSGLERLRYRTTRRRGPTTLANAPAESPADSGPAALAAFCAAALPPAQVFTLRPDRDTVLIGQEGTRLAVPADAFSVPAGSGPLRVELREFYSTPDMILAGLNTRAGDQLLETGGMLQVTATAEGRPVALRPGRTVDLDLPTAAPRPGMQLFQGAPGPDGHLNWQLPDPLLPPEADSMEIDQIGWAAGVDSTDRRGPVGKRARYRRGKRQKAPRPAHRQWPAYPRGEKRFAKDLSQLIDYPEATRKRLKRGRRISRTEREDLREAMVQYRENILRVVRLDFWVDSTGAVTGPQPLSNRDAELNRAVAAALLRLPRWQPGQESGYRHPEVPRPFTARARVRVAFGESGKKYVSGPDWDEQKAMDRHNKHRNAVLWAYRDSVLKARYPQRWAWEQAQLARAKSRLAAIRALDPKQSQSPADTSAAPADTLNNVGYAEGQMYYLLQAQQLGWINCDRFAAPLTSFTVRAEENNVTVVLVFQQIRGIINGTTYGQGRIQLRGPAGGPAVLVAMKREQGVTYLALHPLVVMGDIRPKLVFRPVTAAELRTALAALGPKTPPPPSGGQ